MSTPLNEIPATALPKLRLAGSAINSLGSGLLGLDHNVTVGAGTESQLWMAPHIVRESILLVLFPQPWQLQQGQHKVLWGQDLTVAAHTLNPCNNKVEVTERYEVCSFGENELTRIHMS